MIKILCHIKCDFNNVIFTRKTEVEKFINYFNHFPIRHLTLQGHCI